MVSPWLSLSHLRPPPSTHAQHLRCDPAALTGQHSGKLDRLLLILFINLVEEPFLNLRGANRLKLSRFFYSLLTAACSLTWTADTWGFLVRVWAECMLWWAGYGGRVPSWPREVALQGSAHHWDRREGLTVFSAGSLDALLGQEVVRTVVKVSGLWLWAELGFGLWSPLQLSACPASSLGRGGWLITAAARGGVTVRVKGPLRPWTQGGSRSYR